MSAESNCPAQEELRQLLDGSLSTDRQVACTTHMDSCTCCQERLETIATDGADLPKLVERIDQSEPLATSAYWPALKALDSNANTAATLAAPARSRELSLEFLRPASDSVYLGRIDQFDIMRVLGRGGMGVVFEAFDSRLRRNVALKVLDPELAGDEIARQRFCREARAAASVTHENVVAVHQVEHSGDAQLPYLVMQLVSGESLEQRLTRQNRPPLREIVRISLQAAQGLAAAHAQGLIHRDIKPGNILLESPNDRVKLTDFGLARAAEDVKLTRTGFVSGTPLYMAPEQAMGEATDHRSDLFSLGAIMYEMCAGQPPFSGDSALVILRKITDSKHKPVRELAPNIPEWLSQTVDRLLDKKPANRIQSAADLAELLEFEWALLKTSSDDVPTVCEEEMKKRNTRNRWIAAALAASFLAIGLFGGWMMAGGKSTDAALPAKSSAEPLAVLGANAGAVWSVSFDADGDTVAMAVEDGLVRLWDLPSRSIKTTVNAHRGAAWVASFAHTGDTFATAGDDGLVKLWSPDKSEPLMVFEHPNAVRGLAFAADDQTLFAGDREGNLRRWSVTSNEPLAQAEQPGAIYCVAVSADGQTVASAGSDKIVRLWNAEALTPRLPLEGHTGPVYGLSFSPDGKRLASSGWDRTVRVWETASGQLIKSWPGHEGDIWGVAFSRDGSKLATGGHDGAVKQWNAETGELLATYLGHNIAIHTLAFSADGKRLASGGRDGAARIWEIEP